MRTLGSLANRIRSKNAGPFNLTIDIFCDTKDSYNRIKKEVTKKRISDVYKTKETKVLIFYLKGLKIVKISFPRPIIQGSSIDRDLHGASFGILLEELPITK